MKLSKWETNLFFTLLLIKHNECNPTCPHVTVETDSQEIFNAYEILVEYVAGSKSGSLTYYTSTQNYDFGSLRRREDDRNANHNEDEVFRSIFVKKAPYNVIEINVTYKVTFTIELKKTGVPKKSKLLNKLYLEGEFSDVKIHCDEEVFNCHKIILSGQSEVFKMILSGNSNEVTSGKIEITDASAITMKNLLFYIYHEDLHEDDPKIIVDLLMAAEKYAISGLVNMCVTVLEESLSEKNVVDVMTAAFLTNQQDLFESACDFIFESRIGKQTIEIEAWKELEEKKPTLAFKMLKKAMFKL